jgi:hypothetical protein
MTKKDESDIGDFEDVFNSVTHTSGPCLLLVIATQHNMQTDHVDIFQDFTQGEFLEDDDQNGKVYTSDPPVYHEDPVCCCLLQRTLYGIPTSVRVWFTIMSEFL